MHTQEFLQKVQQEEVKFISLQFSDLLGVIKEVVLPIKELEGALEDGVWFDGSSIEGFARIQESDLFLKPDINTYALVPWQNDNGKTARLICDIHRADGQPFEGDPRFILKKIMKEAAELGFKFNVGPEPEFYLFKRDDNFKTCPIDQGGYFDMSSHEGYQVVKEITTALKNFGINVETSHHEVGKGQYEIDFNYGEALDVADKLLTLKYTVKKISQMHNLVATFMPKPIMGAAGNGMHIHQSLFKGDENQFYDGDDKHKLSNLAKNFIAGQMKHIKAMCSILCPTVNSYKRLVSGFEAPVYITWASMNRSSLVRIPRWFEGKTKAARIELRCPDPSCNPYLVFAVMLKTGLDGIKNNLMPGEPIEDNVYNYDNVSLQEKGIETLPTSLSEALNELKKSEVLKEAMGEHLFNKYIAIKTRESGEFNQQVTSWEISKYLDIY